MGWIVVLIIFVIILAIWFVRKKKPIQRSLSRPTTTEVCRRVVPRHSKTHELLQLGYTKKIRLTIKYRTRTPLPGEPAIKTRDVDVYGLGDEYFDAYCHFRDALRTFKISRVLWARLCEDTYQIPVDYVPSGWVTGEFEELKDAALEKPVQVAPLNIPTSPGPEGSDTGYKQKKQQSLSKEAVTYGWGREARRTYVSYDWQRIFEESIRTVLPDEWSPALPYLFEAYELEKQGADQQKVEEMLEKARQADSNATGFYIARRSIIKKMQNHEHKLE
jgi:hypothetical protein